MPGFWSRCGILIRFEAILVGPANRKSDSLDEALLWEAKELGFSDDRLAQLTGLPVASIRAQRSTRTTGKRSVTYKRVDTCAAEFEAHTPYLYSTYGRNARRARPIERKSSSSAEDPIESGRGSSSIIAVSMRQWRFEKKASKRSWSIAIPKR